MFSQPSIVAHSIAPLPSQVGEEKVVASVRGVSLYRHSRLILDDISLEVHRGQVVALMGPSGVGKTTLLRLLTGQLIAQKGEVVVNGHEVAKLSGRQIYAFRRSIGVLLQSGALFTDMDVFENVAFPLREHTDLPETLLRRLVLAKLQAVGLRGASRLMPKELSGGMARRVALARSLILDPGLMLYDEPTTGLDPISLAAILRLIKQLNDTLGLTSIIVTHDVHEMQEIADYCYILADHGIAAHGTPEDLHDDPSDLVRQFMRGEADGPIPFHYPAEDLSSQLLAPSTE